MEYVSRKTRCDIHFWKLFYHIFISAFVLGACAAVGSAIKCWGYGGQGQMGDGSQTHMASAKRRLLRALLPALVLCHQPCLAVSPAPLLKRLAAFPKEQPLIFGAGLTCVKTAAADTLTQTACLKRGWRELDWGRVGVFALYGALYLGGVQYLLFVRLYPRLLPLASSFAAKGLAGKLADGPGFASVLGQVALDQGLHWPFSAIPCFYIAKGLGEGEPLGASMSALRRNWSADVLACWAFWLPADALSFGVLPLHWQVPFAAAVSFVYTAFVSFRRGERLKVD